MVSWLNINICFSLLITEVPLVLHMVTYFAFMFSGSKKTHDVIGLAVIQILPILLLIL